MVFSFKGGFRLGVATASTQIEGGDVGSNWNWFSDAGKIKDKSNVNRANQHYLHVKEDAELLASLGIRDYRMSIEWARVEPKEGEFSEAALNHYRDELTHLKSLGISPLITFYHFSHPMWFEEKGSFTKRENLTYFLRFIERCLEAFGDLCQDYVTLNEPNVYAVNSYLFGEWPPEKRHFFTTLRVMNVFIEAHLASYQLIHRVRKEKGWTVTRVSFAHHMRVFHPGKDTWFNRLSVKIHRFLFQDGLAKACFNGTFTFPFKNPGRYPKGRYVDFIAINYYTRGHLYGIKDVTPEGLPINDLDWEIYANGLIECCEQCYEMIELPIWITENGTCDNEDRFRSRYIADHLSVVTKSTLPIERYYHWCFIDNFEWKEGESARFGIIHCDYETQVRTIKESGYFYQDLIENHGLTKDAYERYVIPQKYNTAEKPLDRPDRP